MERFGNGDSWQHRRGGELKVEDAQKVCTVKPNYCTGTIAVYFVWLVAGGKYKLLDKYCNKFLNPLFVRSYN